MIKEETLTVTIKKYTALDGTEYIAEGPSLGQANYAKSLCEHRNQMYDFLHFVVDENKLKKYNKTNWLHFKWTFLRKYIKDAYWSNGTVYRDIKNFAWMNGLDKEQFEEIVINSYYYVRYEKGTVVPIGLWRDTDFVTIMVESGILKKKQLSEKYPSEKYKDGGSSILLVHLLKRKNWVSIKKYIHTGYFNITAKDIHETTCSLFDNFFGYYDKEEKMGTKNTLVTLSYGNKDNDTFKYYISKEDRDFLKYMFAKCVSTKEEILYAILSKREYFMSSIYGGVVIFCEHFYSMSRKDAEEFGERLYGYYLWAINGKYEKNDKYRFNDDLLKVIMGHPLRHLDEYRVTSITQLIYQDFLPEYKDKETELEVYFYWATNGRVKWAKIHEILSKIDLKQGICWNYTYQEILDMASSTITKLNENKEKLREIEIQRKKLNTQEKELLKETL